MSEKLSQIPTSFFFEEIKDLVKGDEPNDIKQLCLNECQKYLMGNWTQLTVDDIEVKRLTGGMSNQVYCCRILESKVRDGKQLTVVAIRIYGIQYDFKTQLETHEMIDTEVVGIMASEKGLGPKVYGIFSKGQIQEYYPHRYITEEDLYNEQLSIKLAVKLAQFHAMKPPILKDKNLVLDVIVGMKRHGGHQLKFTLFSQYDCIALMNYDLESIRYETIKCIESSDSPIVFCHNDFRYGNLMLTEDQDIILGDLEQSSYSFRGYDFANLFYNSERLDGNEFFFKDESIVKAFISRYIEENERIFGKQFSENPNNSVKHILNETKVFSMIYSQLLIDIMITNKEFYKFPIEEEMCLKMADSELTKLLTKKRLLKLMKLI